MSIVLYRQIEVKPRKFFISINILKKKKIFVSATSLEEVVREAATLCLKFPPAGRRGSEAGKGFFNFSSKSFK